MSTVVFFDFTFLEIGDNKCVLPAYWLLNQRKTHAYLSPSVNCCLLLNSFVYVILNESPARVHVPACEVNESPARVHVPACEVNESPARVHVPACEVRGLVFFSLLSVRQANGEIVPYG